MSVQIKRLLVVFVLFIGLFLVAKHFLTPKSFNEFGHYRGDALKEIADHEAKYVDMKETCVMCHDSIAALKDSSVHKTINCQVCHGPGYKHVADPQKTNIDKPEVTREFCLKCHAKNAARPKVIKQVDAVEHNKGEVCITCHNPHNPWL